MDGPQIADPADIPRTHLPEKFTVMLSGNFMVLDKHVNSSPLPSESERPSFIEIGFGDNRRGFAGLHRFEVARDVAEEAGEGKEGVRLWYSNISCNPTVDKMPFPGWIYHFHTFYAQSLFRDGIAGVLSD